MQDQNKTSNETGTESAKDKIRLGVLSGSLLPIVLIGIISHVTAIALGDRSEARIKESQWQLETIVSNYMDTLQDIALGTEARPAGLRPIIEEHLRANPPKPDNREIFTWFEAREASMSDFRIDKIDELILEARKEYQVKLTELQEIKRTYQKSIDSVYAGFWLKRNGYPRIEMGERVDG